MDIEKYKYSQSMLKIAQRELGERHNKIVELGIDLACAKRNINVLLAIISIMTFGLIFN
jgi:hypothetical protein